MDTARFMNEINLSTCCVLPSIEIGRRCLFLSRLQMTSISFRLCVFCNPPNTRIKQKFNFEKIVCQQNSSEVNTYLYNLRMEISRQSREFRISLYLILFLCIYYYLSAFPMALSPTTPSASPTARALSFPVFIRCVGLSLPTTHMASSLSSLSLLTTRLFGFLLHPRFFTARSISFVLYTIFLGDGLDF